MKRNAGSRHRNLARQSRTDQTEAPMLARKDEEGMGRVHEANRNHWLEGWQALEKNWEKFSGSKYSGLFMLDFRVYLPNCCFVILRCAIEMWPVGARLPAIESPRSARQTPSRRSRASALLQAGRPQGWNAPIKIAGSTRASFRLTFQCMCGPVARPVEPTLPTTPPRGTLSPVFTSIFDIWQNMLMKP